MTCSPKQNEFLIITKDQPYNKSGNEILDETGLSEKDQQEHFNGEIFSSIAKRGHEDQTMEITQISYYLNSNFTTNMYNSCK